MFKNSDYILIVDGPLESPRLNPGQRALYYVRVLEIPTPRWTTHDVKVLNGASCVKPLLYGFQSPGDL
ncbi:MAG: DUF3604 domain-containing protein [Deltaproteobacteria bacterium]|nr:DUF3604 domain-containing protein [Deltaproteobacteria bacterium]